MLIEAVFGFESFNNPKCQCKIMAFWKASASAEEQPLFDIGRDARSSAKMVSSDTVMAAEGDRRYGYWTISRYDLPEGGYLKLVINKRMGTSIFEDQAHVMLRLRADAALRRLNIPFTGHNMATLREGNVEGRFDIITNDMFEDLGIAVLPLYFPKHDRAHMDEVLTELVLEQERSRFRPPPRPTEIVTEAGEVRKVIRTAGKIRKINLRRPPK
jgi:hypothetical protein